MKKLFSIIMCVLMVMCFMPSMAFAVTMAESSCTECNHEAKVTIDSETTHYDTLSEAITAATNVQAGTIARITLLKTVENVTWDSAYGRKNADGSYKANESGSEWTCYLKNMVANGSDGGKNVVLDLNGHDITLASGQFMYVNNGTLEITGQGTISEADPWKAPVIVTGSTNPEATSYSKLIVQDDVTLKGYCGIQINTVNTDSNGNAQDVYGIEVIVKGKLVGCTDGADPNATGTGIEVKSELKTTEGNVPNITLTETSNVSANGPGVYAAGYANWKMAGTVSGTEAVAIKSGKFEITGGTYSANGIYMDPPQSNDGSDLTGAAISITTDSRYAGHISVTITGGTFTSTNGDAVYEGIARKVGEDGKVSGDYAASESDATVSISGGSFTATNSAADAVKVSTKNENSIASGTFDTDPSEYVADDNNVYKTAAGKYVVAKEAPANTSGYKWVKSFSKDNYYYESAIHSGGGGGGSSSASTSTSEIDKAKAEEEAKIAAEIAAISGVDKQVFKASSKKTTLNGKKAIKITWTLPAGISVDGFEVYRSTERYSGFGTVPYFTTTKSSYTNNKDLKAGKTYYYKVRGYKMINGEKIYTGWSTKAYRTI